MGFATHHCPPFTHTRITHLVHLGVPDGDHMLVLPGPVAGEGPGQRRDDAQAQLAGHRRGDGVADLHNHSQNINTSSFQI